MENVDELKSELVSKLYSVSSYTEFQDLLQRIKVVSNPIFIRPLIDTYQRIKFFKDGSSSIILDALGIYKSQEIKKFVEQEVEFLNTESSIRIFLSLLTKYSIYSKNIEKRILSELTNFFNTQNLMLYYPTVNELCSFLGKNGRLEIVFPILASNLFRFKDLGEIYITLVLDDFFGSDNKKAIEFIKKNYVTEIRGTSIERAITNKLKFDIKDELKHLILTEGSLEAKILIQKDSYEFSQVSFSRPFVAFDLEKLSVIFEIINLRKLINEKIISLKNGEQVFTGDELVVEQTKKIYDESDLTDIMIKLRDYISNISKDVVIKPEKSIIKKILPMVGEQDIFKPLNKLILYLNDKGITVDSNLYGIKEIYRLTTLLGSHHKSNIEKQKMLTKLNLDELYTKNHKSELHLEILKQYRNSLQKLLWKIV